MVKLNYGSIDESGRMPKLTYNASGVAASLTANASQIKEWNSNTLIQAANASIAYIQKYIDWMDQGQFVGQSRNSVFRVQPTQQQLINDCNSYGGGYIKTYTRAELVAMQEPYRKMLEDAATIAAWTPATSNTVYGAAPITPSSPVVADTDIAAVKKNSGAEIAKVEPSMPAVEKTPTPEPTKQGISLGHIAVLAAIAAVAYIILG